MGGKVIIFKKKKINENSTSNFKFTLQMIALEL